MQGESPQALVAAARYAAAAAYAPYSAFRVGAALLGASGRIYVGCNVENASYGLSVCAERAALLRAVADGERSFTALAVVGGAEPAGGECLPCGACRQVLVEFCGDELPVYTATAEGEIRERRLGDLLPEAFRLGPAPAEGVSPPPRLAPSPPSPPPALQPLPTALDWVRGTAAAVADALGVLAALAGAEARQAARETWLPAAVAAAAAATAGALGGAAVAAPPDNALASTAAATALAAPLAILLAAVLVWVRSAAAARASAWAWHGLRVRGAGLWQLWGLVALTSLPRTGAAVVSGAAATLLATLVVAMASFFARTTTSGQIFAGALAWSALAALCLAAAAVLGAVGPSSRPPAHFRTLGAGGAGLARYWPDAILLAVAGVLAFAARAFVAAAPPVPPVAFGGSLAAAAVQVPRFWLLPAVDAAGALLLFGAALLGGRVLSGALGAVERLRGLTLRPSWLLALRAAARGTTRLRLALLPALAAGALAFCIAGPLGVAATDRGLQAAVAGSALQVSAQWPSPCNAALSEQESTATATASCCAQLGAPAAPNPGPGPATPASGGAASGTAGPPGPGADAAAGGAPGTGAASGGLTCIPFTQLAQTIQLPPFQQVGSLAARGAPAASLLETADQWSGPLGEVQLELYGLQPRAFGQVAAWGGVPGGRADLQALAGVPDGAIISVAMARQTGLAVGDRFATRLLPDLRVLAVAAAWPGVGSGTAAWAVVQLPSLTPGLQQANTYEEGGLRTQLLLGAARAPAAIAATFAQYGARVTGTARPTPGAWGLGWLPAALAPVLAGLLLLLWPVLQVSDVDPAAFPQGDALAAVAAEPEARAARRLLAGLVGWCGAAWGLLAGTAAAALLWPAVRIQPAGVAGVPFRPAWDPLLLAAAVALLGLGAGLRTALAAPAREANALIAARVAEAALRTGEPPPRHLPAAVSRAPVRRGPRVSGAGLLRAPALAFALLAARRLAASWPRLLGLGAGVLLAGAVAATVPIYTTGSLTRVLQAGLQPVDGRPAGALLLTFSPGSRATYSAADLQNLQTLAGQAAASAGLQASPVVPYLASQPLPESPAAQAGQPGAQAGYLALDAIAGWEGHVTLEQGVLPSATPEADGTLEAAATDETMTQQSLSLGQVYAFSTPDGGALRVKIVGIFAEADPQGDFWPFEYFHHDLFIDYGTLQGLVTGVAPLPLDEAAWYQVLGLNSLNAETVPAALRAMAGFQVRLGDALPGASLEISPFANLSGFVQRETTLTALLRLVAVPILAMTLYFVALTAGLIVEAESGEISVYTSRGANAWHILLLYVLEWVLLAVPLAAVAPFPATLFARAMGAASGFLHFVPRPPLPVFLQRRDFIYAAGASALAVAAALLPTAAAMGRSIVAARLRASRTVEQPLWQRAYLDVLAVAALAVAWWIFRGVSLGTGGAAAIVADPALYLLPAIFLAVCGLLAVRFLGWLLRTLDAAWGPWLQPAAVLPLRRIGRLPAQFAPVLLLLCFTAALGTYSAAAARTLDSNLVASVRYEVGAPLRLEEASACSQMQDVTNTACAQYDDVIPQLPPGGNQVRPLPPFNLHFQVKGIADASELDVLAASFSGGGLLQIPASLVLVDPGSFQQVAWWNSAWDALSESRYLDLLQSRPDAVLVSPDAQKLLAGAKQLQLSVQGGAPASFTNLGTVGYWPGADVTGPTLVADLQSATTLLGLTCGPNPCVTTRVALITTRPGVDPTTIAAQLAPFGIAVTRQDVAASEAATALATPEWAGQSGLLTIGFLVALAVTIVGYLLYAGLVLRGQLSQLGLLRALGLDWNAVVGTVALEQGILVVAGALAGALSGMIAAALFLPLFRPAFTGPSAPPFASSGPGAALWEVAAVLLVLFGIVLASLLALLRRMHVGETVKLEE